MRSLWIFIVIIALILLGLFITLTKPRATDQGAIVEEVAAPIAVAEGRVTAVDRNQMVADGPGLVTIESAAGAQNVIAVPSMGRLLCAALGSVADVYAIEVGDMVSVRGARNEEGHIVPCDDAGHYLKVRGTYLDPNNSFSFSYEKGPSGYVLEESEVTLPEEVVALTLTETPEFEAMQDPDVVREGPATIQVHVFKNPLKYSSFVWVERNPVASGKDRILSPIEETVLGGANAARYTVDGLYAADTIVAAHGDHVYMLTGMYVSEESKMYSDFLALIDTFTFPAPVTP